jgi:hypothetical protein
MCSPMSRIGHLLTLAALAVSACGDDGGSTVRNDAAADSPGMIDAALPAGCDYVEQRDATNDDVSPATGTAEVTNLIVATHTAICGNFEHTHFDGDITVDIDAYRIAVASDTDVLVRISGAGAEGIELVGVDIYGGPQLDQRVGGVTFYGDHGVTAVHLAPGTYELLPFALNSAAITATVPYKMSIDRDMPATRCTDLTTGGYAEANDGGTSTGNDMVSLPSGGPPALTTSTADSPEPSGVTVMPATSSRLTGSAADVTIADRYEDKDTFAFATDATANELTVRLSWTTAANVDFFVLEAGNPGPVWTSTDPTAKPETNMFSLKPSTNYWLLVGAKPGSGLPAPYSATLCGAVFTP